MTNDVGQGFLHNTSPRCIGLGRTFKGATEDSGNCVYVDADGDKIFPEWTDQGSAGVGAKGSGNLIRGTCEYTGIRGSFEYERIGVRPVADGTFQGYAVSLTGDWKLP